MLSHFTGSSAENAGRGTKSRYLQSRGRDNTEVSVTEYDWPVGHMMEMSKMSMEQCLDKMAAIFGKA